MRPGKSDHHLIKLLAKKKSHSEYAPPRGDGEKKSPVRVKDKQVRYEITCTHHLSPSNDDFRTRTYISVPIECHPEEAIMNSKNMEFKTNSYTYPNKAPKGKYGDRQV